MKLIAKKRRRKRKLRNSIMITCVVFAAYLSFAVTQVGFACYVHSMYQKYESYLYGVLECAAYQMDSQGIADAIADEEWNEACEHLKLQLDAIKETMGIQFIYVVIPLNTNETDNMLNVMVGETAEEKKSGDSVAFLSLTGDSYSPEVAEKYLACMDGRKDITYFDDKTEWGYSYTGIAEISDQDGNTVALLCADINMDQIHQTLAYFITLSAAGAVFLTVIFLIFLFFWMNHRVIRPIQKIETFSQDFVKSSHEAENPEKLEFTRPDIHTRDEMEGLADSVTSMAEDLKKYMTDLVKEASEKQRISTELNLATTIQASYLPSVFPPFPDRKEFDIYASMDPAKEVGGDFFDFFFIDPDHLCLVIADVSGKGIPAALFMMISKTLIRNQAAFGLTPRRILQEVNNRLCENNTAEMFVTAWVGVLEISTGKVTAANAGHEYPTIRHAGGSFELLKDRHGFVLGGMAGVRYSEYEFQINPGDSIFVYTDGVPEATNAENELFGTDRMLAALNLTPDAVPNELLKTVRSEVDRFVAEAPQFDDLTMLSLKYYGQEK